MRALIGFLMLLGSALAAAIPTGASFDSTHGAWNRLLAANVHWNAAGTTTTVDYAAFARDRTALANYMQSLASVSEAEFGRWPLAERQSFLINAYNAGTVTLVLTRYPGLKSIKEIGGLFGSPWKQDALVLLGKQRTLDEVEHTLLRGAPEYAEPRIHFAVNCASIGCPALRPEAYVGVKLDRQLDDQTRRFLRDRSRNRNDPRAGLRVSKIFDWYGSDFDAHAGGVGAFLARYAAELGLDRATAQRLISGAESVGFTPYDWRLNGKQP